MKENIIETAGKTWQFLGENGETDITALSKSLHKDREVVLQSLGWLAREDKIAYNEKNKKTFVSLIDSERQIFNSVRSSIVKAEASKPAAAAKAKRKTATRRKTKKA